MDLRSQPRNWAQFIHEFIGHQWVRPCRRSEESYDVVIGVAKIFSSVGKGSHDSWSDKSYPGFQFSAVEFLVLCCGVTIVLG